jgi:tagatose 1,6-diphosphate aldolase
MTTMTPGKLLGLKRISDTDGRFRMVAVDQRPPIEQLVSNDEGKSSFDDVVRLKSALINHLGPHSSAVLMDPQYVFPTAIPLIPKGVGLILTLEDDSFVTTPSGRLSSAIPDWNVQKIQASGGDAVKVLAWYRPDASQEVRERQQEFVAGIGAECSRLDIPFVFELLLYTLPGEDGHTGDYVENPQKRSDHVLQSVEAFSDRLYGIDVFKLESPYPASVITDPDKQVSDQILEQAFADLDHAAGRPWVMLSAGADAESFYRILELAYGAGASGFLAGRAIWWDACSAGFPDWDEVDRQLDSSAVPYLARINRLTERAAMPWIKHRLFGVGGPTPPTAGAEFRSRYLATN